VLFLHKEGITRILKLTFTIRNIKKKLFRRWKIYEKWHRKVTELLQSNFFYGFHFCPCQELPATAMLKNQYCNDSVIIMNQEMPDDQ